MTDQANSDEREDQVEKIAEEFLQQLRQREKPSTAEFAELHPELAPELEKRLKLVESIFKSAASKDSEKTQSNDSRPNMQLERTEHGHSTIQSLPVDVAARFACPHCGNKVQLVGRGVNEVTCGGCGSSLKIARPAIAGVSQSTLPIKLGRFIIKRVLGEGAFGIVFLATDPQLQRDVALKTPRNGFFPTLEEERRFFREAKHAASLQHPNIVQVFEVAESEETPLIVSEYIDGLTLNDVASGNLLTFKETARLLIQIAKAVEFAHQKGVIHRDLKPGNILLDADRNAYITDFGLAYRDDAEITMTMDGAILGTPAYMAPEQAQGNQQLVGRRSDVYSLGVILYRLATKDLPFHGTKRMLVQQVIHEDPKPPRMLNDRIPRDLETIILKAMAKSPEARYQTAGELAAELERFLMGEPIHARPVSSLGRLSRWCVRRPAVAALSGSIAALLLLCATITSLWAVSSDRLKRSALKSEGLATQYALESSNRLHDLLLSNGSTELKQNNLTNSSLWFAQALAMQDKPNARIRLAMIQDQTPTLVHLVADLPLCKSAFSADATRFVLASDKRVRVFDTESKRCLFDEQLSGKRFTIAPDGKKLVVAGNSERSNSIAIWDIDNRRLTSTVKHAENINSFEFDQRSSKVVTGSEDSFAKVWNTSDGSLVGQHAFEGFRIVRAAFVPNTNTVAIVVNRRSELSCKVLLWDFVQDVLVGDEMPHDSYILGIRLSADGKRICIGDEHGRIKVWDAASGKQVGVTITTNKKLMDAQFIAKDTFAIGLFANGEVATFDYNSGALLTVFVRTTKFSSLSQSADSSILALGSEEGKVTFVWRESGIDVCTPINNGPSVTSVNFHADNRRVTVTGSGGALQIWDLAGSSPNSFVFEHAAPLSNAIFIPGSTRCVTISLDGKGYIWNSVNGQRVGETLEHEAGINCVSVSRDGRFIVTGGTDKLVKVWDSLTGKPVGGLYAHEAEVIAAIFNADGSHVFSSDRNGTIRCWEVGRRDSDESKPVFEVQQNALVVTLRLSPDGNTLASGSDNGLIRLWNAVTGRPFPVQLEHGHAKVNFRFLPDSKRLISCGDSEATIIWDLSTGVQLQKLLGGNSVSDVQVSNDGSQLVIVERVGTAAVWKVDDKGTYQLERTFSQSPLEFALGVRLNTANNILVLGGGMLTLRQGEPARGSIHLWDFADGRPLSPTLRQRATVQHLALSEDARFTFTALDDSTARLWKISSTDHPTVDLQRVSQLYAQHVPDIEGGLKLMDVALQVTEFEELKVKYPSYFNVDDADRKIWEYELRELAKDEE